MVAIVQSHDLFSILFFVLWLLFNFMWVKRSRYVIDPDYRFPKFQTFNKYFESKISTVVMIIRNIIISIVLFVISYILALV